MITSDNTTVPLRRPVERFLNSQGRAYTTAIEAIDSDLIGALQEAYNRLSIIRVRVEASPAGDLKAAKESLDRVATLIAERRAAP